MKKVQHKRVKHEKFPKVGHYNAQTGNGLSIDKQLYIDKITGYNSTCGVHENDKIRRKISKSFLDVKTMIWKSNSS